MRDLFLAATGPLSALVAVAVILILAGVAALDAARQRAKRRALCVLSVASRAKTLSDCPPEFHARLRQAMHLDDTEEVA